VQGLIPLLVILLIVVLAALLARPFVALVTVHDYQRGLRYRQGRFSGLVDPGSHLIVRPFSEILVVDGRPAFVTLEGQEILTADVVPIKISLAARYVIGDPVAAMTGDQSFSQALRLELQLGLREAMAGRTADQLLAERAAIGPAILEATATRLGRIGIELLSVEVRDLMISGELKRAFAGVVTARKEGEAALERARGETASLRNLANAGRMVEDNPGLLQLRLLQQLGASPGSSVVLTMPERTGGVKDGRPSSTKPPAPSTKPPAPSTKPPAPTTRPARGRRRVENPQQG
jgi:regulator of protease activity HflC (stomatin/prohibitin superfamily)